MTTKTKLDQQWRVVVGLVMFNGKTHGNTPVDRHGYRGDFVPPWVPAEEIERLAAGGFIVPAEDYAA